MRKREPAPELAALESRMSQELEAEVIETQDTELPSEDDQDIDPENPDGDVTESETPEVTDEAEGDGLEITIEGFESEATPEEEANAKPWVNELRKKHREAQKRIRELESQLNQGQKQEESVIVGEKPTLAGCDYDDEKYDREMDAYYARKAKFDAQQREKQQAQEAEKRAWESRVSAYQEQKKALPVADYEEAESIVDAVMSQTQAAIIIKLAPNPAEVVYALSKNEKALQHLAAKKDPTEFIWELRGLVEKMKKTEPGKKSIPAPERVVRGGGGKTPASTSSNLEKLREEAARTGDFTKYFEAKRRAG